MVEGSKSVCWRDLKKTWKEKDQLSPVMEYSCFPDNRKGLLGQMGGDRKEIIMYRAYYGSLCILVPNTILTIVHLFYFHLNSKRSALKKELRLQIISRHTVMEYKEKMGVA